MSTPFLRIFTFRYCNQTPQTGYMCVPDVRLQTQRTIASSSPHLVLLVCGSHTHPVAQPRNWPHPCSSLCTPVSFHRFFLLNVQAKTPFILTANLSPQPSAPASQWVFLPGSSSGLDNDVGSPGTALGEILEPSLTGEKSRGLGMNQQRLHGSLQMKTSLYNLGVGNGQGSGVSKRGGICVISQLLFKWCVCVMDGC